MGGQILADLGNVSRQLAHVWHHFDELPGPIWCCVTNVIRLIIRVTCKLLLTGSPLVGWGARCMPLSFGTSLPTSIFSYLMGKSIVFALCTQQKVDHSRRYDWP